MIGSSLRATFLDSLDEMIAGGGGGGGESGGDCSGVQQLPPKVIHGEVLGGGGGKRGTVIEGWLHSKLHSAVYFIERMDNWTRGGRGAEFFKIFKCNSNL